MDNRAIIQQGLDYIDLYFYLTKRLPGTQMVAHRFDEGDGRFVGEIIGQLHLTLARIEDCVNDG